MTQQPPSSTLFPYTTLFRSGNSLNNSITGGSGADTLNSGDGADTVSAGDGKDAVLGGAGNDVLKGEAGDDTLTRSEEHTSELQSQSNLVCRLLLEKKKQQER